MAGVLARLRTFELIEGGRRSSFPSLPPSASTSTAFETRASSCDDDGQSSGGYATGVAGGTKGDCATTENGATTTLGDSDDGDGGCGGVDENDDPDVTAGRKGVNSKNNKHNVVNTGSSATDSDHGQREGDDSNSDEVTTKTTTSNRKKNTTAAKEVARWLRFRTTDMVAFVGAALQAGDVQAASIVWRRHGRTDRGAASFRHRISEGRFVPGDAGAGDDGGGSERTNGKGIDEEEDGRVEVALPGQLAVVPADASLVLLGTWLKDEVLPSLDVAGAMAVSEVSRILILKPCYQCYYIVDLIILCT